MATYVNNYSRNNGVWLEKGEEKRKRKWRNHISMVDRTRFKWSKNVFNRVVHYQLVRGIDEEKREEMEENK